MSKFRGDHYHTHSSVALFFTKKNIVLLSDTCVVRHHPVPEKDHVMISHQTGADVANLSSESHEVCFGR